jgi:hypothetical protein
MPQYSITGHFTVAGLNVPPGPERERRIEVVREILEQGLSKCASIDRHFIGRQMRPWNTGRDDGLPEPDLVEVIEITGDSPAAVFETYRDDPSHANMVKKLRALGWAKWQVVVCEMAP